MTRLEKCKYLESIGYTYDELSGHIISHKNNIITNKRSNGYIQIMFKLNGKFYSLLGHQFAWFYTYEEVVKCIDHINLIKTDNRILNLRSVTYQQNHFNSNAKGYSFCKSRNKYESYINLNGKKINLGRFNTEIEAREAYLKAKEKHHIIN